MKPHRTLSPPAAESSGDVTVFTFSAPAVRDEEDMLGKELRGHTDDLDGRHLLLNFAHVRGIYSTEIGTLISLHKQLRAAGGRLTLFGLNSDVYEVLVTMRLDGYLEICRGGDAEDAERFPVGIFKECQPMSDDKRYVLCRRYEGGLTLFLCGPGPAASSVSDDVYEAREFASPDEALAFRKAMPAPQGRVARQYAVHEWRMEGDVTPV